MSVQMDDAAVREFLDEVEPGLLDQYAEQVAGAGRMLGPKRTGMLASSIATKHNRDSDGPYVDVTEAWYGVFTDPKSKQMHRDYFGLHEALRYVSGGGLL